MSELGRERRPCVHVKNREEQAAAGRPMPQVNEEYGYEDHYRPGAGTARPRTFRRQPSSLAWVCTGRRLPDAGERADTGTGWGPDTGGGWINVVRRLDDLFRATGTSWTSSPRSLVGAEPDNSSSTCARRARHRPSCRTSSTPATRAARRALRGRRARRFGRGAGRRVELGCVLRAGACQRVHP